MIERSIMFAKKRFFKNKEDFLEIFNRIESDAIVQDFNGVPCFAPKAGIRKLKDSNDFAGDILMCCGLKNDSTFQSYYYAGFNEFAEFLGLWGYGFRSLEAIDRIMRADKKRYFAKAVYSDGMFADYTDKEFRDDKYKHTPDYYRENGNIQTCFSFIRTPWLYEQIRVLLQKCSETTTGYLVQDFLKHPRKMKLYESAFLKKYRKEYAFEAIINVIKDCTNNFINGIAIPKLRQEGFSKKTFDYIVEEFTKDCDTWEFPSKKEGIPYTQEELNLEWEKDGYRFLLPKKVGMVYTLNKKKFSPKNQIIDMEVLDKWTTQIYVMKGNKYKFLFELPQFEGEDYFTLIEATLPKPWTYQKMTYKEYELIKAWCKEKNIVIDYYRSSINEIHETIDELRLRKPGEKYYLSNIIK